jgi:hypothetical protein
VPPLLHTVKKPVGYILDYETRKEFDAYNA